MAEEFAELFAKIRSFGWDDNKRDRILRERLIDFERFRNQVCERLAVGQVSDVQIFPPLEPVRTLHECRSGYGRCVLFNNIFFLHRPLAFDSSRVSTAPIKKIGRDRRPTIVTDFLQI